MALIHTFAALLAMQQPAPQQALPPSPVKRIEVTPRTRTVVAGDSMKLSARALDAAGQVVPNATVVFRITAGQGEGNIDSLGTVIGSTIGKMPTHVVALVPGTAPFIDSLEIHIVPGPATRIMVPTKARKFVV